MRLVGPAESYCFQYSANGLQRNESLEILMLVNITIFWDVTPWRLVDRVHISYERVDSIFGPNEAEYNPPKRRYMDTKIHGVILKNNKNDDNNNNNNKVYLHVIRRHWGPPSLSHSRYQIKPRGRAAGAWCYSHPPSANIKERVELYFGPSSVPS